MIFAALCWSSSLLGGLLIFLFFTSASVHCNLLQNPAFAHDVMIWPLCFGFDCGVAFDLIQMVLTEFSVFAAHHGWKQKKKRLIFPPPAPRRSSQFVPVMSFFVKGRVNVMKSASLAKWVRTSDCLVEAPEASYL